MTPETRQALAAAFERLNAFALELHPTTPVLWANETSVSLQLGENIGRCGDYEMEYNAIEFTWEELLDAKLDLNALAKQRWQEAEEAARRLQQEEYQRRQAREEAERKAAQAAFQAKKRAKAKREAEFRARFPDAAAFLDAGKGES